MKKLLVLALLVGCGTPGMIQATSIDTTVYEVTARHDVYVRADPTLSAAQRASDLRSTELLRRVVDEAKAAAVRS